MSFFRNVSSLIVACAVIASVPSVAEGQICGSSTVTLWAGQNLDAGSVEVSNDDMNLYVTFSLAQGWAMTESHVHVGSSLEEIPQTKSGNPKIGNFEFKSEYDPAMASDTYVISLDAIDGFSGCGESIVIAAHAALQYSENGNVIQTETGWGDGPSFPGRSWATYVDYGVECCTDPPDEGCAEQNRTQTQGGWGTECNGNNPGCYRDDNFESCLGELVIGGDWNSATFTTSFAIETFLPQGGKPSTLDSHATDPTSTSAGVLAGQVTALSLSVAFDDCDPNFGASDIRLGSMVIVDSSSVCYGWTVDQVLAAGNCVLNGDNTCGISSASEVNECLTTINQAFVDGTGNTGDVCTVQ